MKLPWLNKKTIPLLSPLEGYERLASRYPAESNPIKNLSNETIQKLLPDLRGKSVLDAGCGAGYFCRIAHNGGASNIVGMDISPRMLQEAKITCPVAEYLCADISTEAPRKGAFDVVILSLVLGHIQDITSVLANLSAALRPGGTFILSDFHPRLTQQKARRTFKDESGIFEIQHHLHLLPDLIQQLHQHRVELEELVEPVWNDGPVVYVIRAKNKE